MKKGFKNVPVERTIFDDEEQRRYIVAILLYAIKCSKTLQIISDLPGPVVVISFLGCYINFIWQ